jgi:hypothetical protein
MLLGLTEQMVYSFLSPIEDEFVRILERRNLLKK